MFQVLILVPMEFLGKEQQQENLVKVMEHYMLEAELEVEVLTVMLEIVNRQQVELAVVVIQALKVRQILEAAEAVATELIRLVLMEHPVVLA